ncbi:hypothetical protein A2U01_0093235, partial [Trifolium medium]|nr:hypothetical protein [Trifolium medium]
MGSSYRAGLSTRCTEQESWLVVQSKCLSSLYRAGALARDT